MRSTATKKHQRTIYIAKKMQLGLLALSSLLLISGCAIAQSKSENAPESLSAQQIIKLLIDAGETEINTIPSCALAAYPDAKTVGDYLSHYLAVLSEESDTAIAISQGEKGSSGELSVRFILNDPQSPWDYGFRFRVKKQGGTEGSNGYSIERESLTCTGAG